MTSNSCPNSEIYDDGYRHALRIYRDHHSKAVRLQASVATGPMKKSASPFLMFGLTTNAPSSTPVWTAFITDNMLSRGWYRLVRRRYVCLRSLHRHVFSDRYTPQFFETGEPVLEFIKESGMYFSLSLGSEWIADLSAKMPKTS
jgi:hypothetical protein